MKKVLVTLLALALFFGGIAGVYYFYRNTDCSLTISVSPANSGVVVGNNEKYESGATVELVANPSLGYEFVDYKEGGTSKSTNADYSFVIRKDTALTATFRLKEYTLTFVDGEWSETRVLHYGDAIGALPTRVAIWKIGGLTIAANSLYNYTSNQTALPDGAGNPQTNVCNIVFNYSGIYSNELPTMMETTMENVVAQDTIENFFQNNYPTKSLTGNRAFEGWTTVNPNATPTPTHEQLVAGIIDESENLDDFVTDHSGQTVVLYAIWGAENSAGGEEEEATCNITFNYSDVYSNELPNNYTRFVGNVAEEDTLVGLLDSVYPTKSKNGDMKFVAWTTINPMLTPAPTLAQQFAGVIKSNTALGNFVTTHNGESVILYAIWGQIDSANDTTTSYLFNYQGKSTGTKMTSANAVKGVNNTLQAVYYNQTNAHQIDDVVGYNQFAGLSLTSTGSAFGANINLDYYVDYYTGDITFYALWTELTQYESDIVFNYSNVYSNELPTTMEITMEDATGQDTIENFFQDDYPTKSLTGNKKFVGWSTVNPKAIPAPSLVDAIAGLILDTSVDLGAMVNEYEGATIRLYAIWGEVNSFADDESDNRTDINFDYGINESNLDENFLRNVTTTRSNNDNLNYLYFGNVTKSTLIVGDDVDAKIFMGFAFDETSDVVIDEELVLTLFIEYFYGDITLYAVWQ